MTPERWAQADEILQTSLGMAAEQRRAFLETACGEDGALRREVESLLAAHEKAGTFLETPAIQVEARALAANVTYLAPGSRIGQYRIVSTLGSGGMGHVYRALDPKLGRDVAIKILADHHVDDREGFPRLVREAKAASALNHPNVLTIYEVGESDGSPFIASEFIEGRTLRSHIREGAMAAPAVIALAVQIAEALAVAHKTGIIHGDVKPENVMIRSDGLVKVLDFGLSRCGVNAAGVDGCEHNGAAGTMPYMSPEQIRGQALDASSDVFSLGVIIYEMICGGPPFQGASVRDLAIEILERDPTPLREVAQATPTELQRIVGKALSKNLNERYGTAQGLLNDLKSLQQQYEQENRKRRLLAPVFKVSAAAAMLILIIVLGLWTFGRETHSSIAKLTPITSNGKAVAAAISADGKRVAYGSADGNEHSLWIRELTTFRDRLITPPSETEYAQILFSNDGQSLYYVARDRSAAANVLVKTSPPGENPSKIVSGFISDVTFSPDGKRIAFVRARPFEYALTVADSDGTGEQELFARPMGPDTIGQHLAWSPDGRTIICTAGDRKNPPYGTLIAVNVNDRTEKQIPVRPGQLFRSLAWDADGRGLVLAALDRSFDPVSQLWYVGYSDGAQRKITNDLQEYRGISLSNDGTALVSVQESPALNLWTMIPRENGRAIQARSRIGKDDGQYGVAWTPDNRIVFTSTLNTSSDLWIMNADGSDRRPLTSGTNRKLSPAVSADGRYLVFVSNQTGSYGIWRLNLTTGELKYLTAGGATSSPQLTPDGKWVVYYDTTSTNRFPILSKVSIDGGVPAPVTKSYSQYPAVSPDGTLIAYSYLHINGTRASRKLRVAPFHGGEPTATFDIPSLVVRWTPDGKALSYVRTERGVSNIWRQPLDGAPATRITDFPAEEIHQFAWSRDGQLAISRGTIDRDVVLISDFR